MDDIFGRQQAILIADVQVNGKNADIFVRDDGTIGAIGEGVRKQHTGEADIIIDGNGAIALPGLVNTHTHAAMSLLRGYADDMILQDWLSQKIWPLEAHLTPPDVYWGTKLACLEMIRTGTTAFNDMYFMMEEAARAVGEAGIRAVLSYGFIDLFDAGKREAECRATENLVRHIRSLDNPRITAAAGPHAPYTVSPDGLKWCAEFAREEKIGIHIHLSETEKEVNDCIAQHGKRPAVLLDECGILTPRTVAAHCCWLDEAECTLLGKRGVSASHNPTSNMKLATNRAMPWHWLKDAGANVCLGTDGCASNNNLDMFEEAKTAAILQKFFWNNPTLLPAQEALAMATANGARGLGLATGRLLPGTPADIILVAVHEACNTPLHNAMSNIVYSCNGGAVETTICDGRVLMLNREVPGEKEILEGASAAAADLVRRAQSS
ncbi:amidohydrolase family protein [Methanoregula sp. PtaB.Bin085]|uniref:amidohydrolase family protein n=2 Tax=unclassified Methanoregula TaxID=2649730 RepID=UPI0009CE9F53|nr:amidohydrolase family protein [Methanoregula sp. PtaB.Bin085]OPX62978.1 MAG: N-ethylammeline chlorohydrolase [Methanoregula sp. PtaB.Bin085]